jgi:hypothetical protein
MHADIVPERKRLLDRLVREIGRAEMHAAEHASRMEKLIGCATAAPVVALRDVAKHAIAMRPRFERMVDHHDLQPGARGGIGATLATLRGIVSDRVHDAERAYRTCLLDLRHGVDVVKLAREVGRTEELFGIIRWCDDWLTARRTLLARVEAQLVWFVEEAGVAIGIPPAPAVIEPVDAPPEPAGTTIALPIDRHEQGEASPEHRLGMHPSRTT